MSGIGMESRGRQPASRRDAVRHLLQPRLLRDFLIIARPMMMRDSVVAGLQASVALAVIIPLALLSPWPHMVGFAALGALVALFGRSATRRGRAWIVLQAAVWQTLAVGVMSLLALAGLPPLPMIGLLGLSCGLFLFITVSGEFGPPGPLIFIFAAGAAMAPVGDMAMLIERVGATGAAGVVALLICVSTDWLRRRDSSVSMAPREADRPLSHRLVAALRVAAAAALAASVTKLLGAQHPVWAAMGAVAVLQGRYLHVNLNRALQRLLGTALGALVVWALLASAPPLWLLVVVLIALQFVTELVIGLNYGLGQIFVTPMALLMSHLAAPQFGVEMAPERVADTLVGVGIGMVIAVLLSTLDDRHHLAEHRARAK